MTGFYPHLPKIFVVRMFKNGYCIVDTRNGARVEKVPFLKDALRTCDMKNSNLR